MILAVDGWMSCCSVVVDQRLITFNTFAIDYKAPSILLHLKNCIFAENFAFCILFAEISNTVNEADFAHVIIR